MKLRWWVIIVVSSHSCFFCKRKYKRYKQLQVGTYHLYIYLLVLLFVGIISRSVLMYCFINTFIEFSFRWYIFLLFFIYITNCKYFFYSSVQKFLFDLFILWHVLRILVCCLTFGMFDVLRNCQMSTLTAVNCQNS